MAITDFNQSYNNFDRYRREISDRSEIVHEKSLPSKFGSIQYRQKPSRYKLLKDEIMIHRYDLPNVQHSLYLRRTISNTWRSIKNNKKLNLNYLAIFLSIIYDLRGRKAFVTKTSFKNYLLANPSLQEEIIKEYNKMLWRYINRDAFSIYKTELFHPKRFRNFCYKTLEIKPLIVYEEINDPPDFYINSELQDNDLLSEKSFEIFVSELQNVEYNKDLAKFYSKRNHKIKKKIK